MLVCACSAAPALDVKIDPSRTGEAISPYIYGQFIEHLGRCIYGGVWAEMLEDRKFYFPITADYAPYRDLKDSNYPVVGASPWQIIGDPAHVTMVRENAFVGEHSPRLGEGSGIRQLDLGVVAGKTYEGYIWACPTDGPAKISVTLSWGDKDSDRATSTFDFSGRGYTQAPFFFQSGATLERGARFEIRVLAGSVLLGPPSLMPGDNVHGLRADTLALLKELGGTIYRWPGGNFASGYDWRDGIGNRDRRPPRKNPAWTGVEHNDFGTDEFIALCREIDAEPMIAANTGFGDAYSAAQWVEYCNRGSETIGGKWRIKNGNAQPYRVKFWCVGNEMFGPWQLGYMQMHHYVLKHNLFAEAMWKVDPKLSLTAVGDLDTINKATDPEQAKSGKTCSRIMLEECADHMSILSEHFYRGRLPWTDEGRVDLLAHVTELRDSIRQKADGHRALQASLPNLHGKLIPITMDEWNYWHREYSYGELGCTYELQDGLGVAEGLHEYYRQSDLIRMAHYAQTVNVIGAIKTSRIAAQIETTGLVLEMYRRHYGQVPLKLDQEFGPIDVAAAVSADGQKLTLGVVNPTTEARTIRLDATGLKLAGSATRWTVAGAKPAMHNTPGQPRIVDIVKTDLTAETLAVPAMSASVIELALR
jgi:alpha-N-arabinofuranosidase